MVPCEHSRVGCPDCRRERAARAPEGPREGNMPATKATMDLVLMMLEAARREIRDQAAAIGRLGAENKSLREQLDELRTKQRKMTRRGTK